jgi:hypothetical protein
MARSHSKTTTIKLRQVVGGNRGGSYYALLIDPDSGEPIHRVLLWATPGNEFLDLVVSFYPTYEAKE